MDIETKDIKWVNALEKSSAQAREGEYETLKRYKDI